MSSSSSSSSIVNTTDIAIRDTSGFEHKREMGSSEVAKSALVIAELQKKSTFDVSKFLAESFPRTFLKGKELIEQATAALEKGIEAIVKIPDEMRTFENTVMAYHDVMIAFDAVERLIRSERLIADDTPKKQELVDECVRVKEKMFSSAQLLHVFISYAAFVQKSGKMSLSAAEWECLRGIINSIPEKHMADREVFQQVKNGFTEMPKSSFTHLQGTGTIKTVAASKKAFSYLTVNLCLMPETSSMIYGGLLPWRTRIEAISEKLKSLNPDIIFLQEIYDVRAIFELHNRLSTSYADFYGNITPRLCGFSHESISATSGLGVISKFKLGDVHFEPFQTITEDKPSGFDRLKMFGFDRNYGILHTQVKSGDEVVAHIATTHENPFFAEVRAKQTKQVVESFTSKTANKPSYPFILCGDINIEKGDMSEGGERLIKEHFIDSYQGGPTCYDFNDYWHKFHRDVTQFVQSKHTPWTVDRSLLFVPPHASSGILPTLKVERILMNDLQHPEQALTDHHGLLTQFSQG